MTHKSRLEELAIFGESPAFAEQLHVGRPNDFARSVFLQAVDRILDRNILTNNGPEVHALEERFRILTASKCAVAVSNATLGLQLLARALGLRGRVIMPAFTFVATAHAFKWIGLEPVFCDIDPATHNLNPDQVAIELAAGASAVVGVHLWGRLCAPIELEAVCAKYNVPLIFDAAHALGCSGYGRRVGGFGTAEVFSLHATKICSSFEGGVITTNNESLAALLRSMRNFGFSGYDQVDGVGINAKLPEVSAAMGVVSLESLPWYIEVNKSNAERYRKKMGSSSGLSLIDEPANQILNYQYVTAEIDSAWQTNTRDILYEALHAEGVLVRRYFYPGCHRLKPYIAAGTQQQLPFTDSACKRVLCFPTGTSVGNAEIDSICELTKLIMRHLPQVAARRTNSSL